jgi:hypothetical protein
MSFQFPACDACIHIGPHRRSDRGLTPFFASRESARVQVAPDRVGEPRSQPIRAPYFATFGKTITTGLHSTVFVLLKLFELRPFSLALAFITLLKIISDTIFHIHFSATGQLLYFVIVVTR